ncbi:MAG: hypothetical protein FWE27_05670 [Defluviitaleaceae bacterium]|nr:hypothetical protein [Defluviitaleaceae bacterium]
MIILWILLGLIAALLTLILFVILLSAVPIKYKATAEINESTNISVRVSWFFWLVRFVYENHGGIEKTDFRILFFKIGARKKKNPVRSPEKTAEKISSPEKIPEKKPPPKKESVYKSFANLRDVLTESKVKTIIKPLAEVVKKIFKLLYPKHINVSGVMGLPCPFETGLIFGVYETVAGFLNIRDKVRFAGDFNTDVFVFRANAEVRGRVSVFRIAFPVIGLVLKKPVRVVLKDVIKGL